MKNGVKLQKHFDHIVMEEWWLIAKGSKTIRIVQLQVPMTSQMPTPYFIWELLWTIENHNHIELSSMVTLQAMLISLKQGILEPNQYNCGNQGLIIYIVWGEIVKKLTHH